VTSKIGTASGIVQRLQDVLANLVADAARMADVSNASASASVEQAQGIAQVALGLRQIDEAVQRTSIAATHTEEAAHRMDREMRELRKLLPGVESGPMPALTHAEDARGADHHHHHRAADVSPSAPRAIVLDGPLPSGPSSSPPVDLPRRRDGEAPVPSSSGGRRAPTLAAPLESEGDRVVRPGDRIVLDDREFGRY